MTPQQLHAALDAARRERGLAWWQVAAQLDVSVSVIGKLRNGRPSPGLSERAPAWLERRPSTARTE